METRVSYILVGGFVLGLMAALFVATIWLAKIKLEGDRDVYVIRFSGSVTGLQVGSPVRYRGVPVGVVTGIRIDPQNVARVQVRVEVEEGTPIKTDTIASLELQGLTGAAYVQLSGGSETSALLAAAAAEQGVAVPVIPSRPSTIAEVVDAAPQILQRMLEVADRVPHLLNPENVRAISNTLSNVEAMSGELATAAAGLDEAMAEARVAMAEARSALATFDRLATELRPELTGAVAQARGTLATVDRTADALSGEVTGLLRSFRQSSDQLAALLAENREPLRDFTGTGLYELTSTLAHLRNLTDQISRVVTRIENDPSNFLFGGTRQGLEVR